MGKVSVLGGGAWGTALAKIVAQNGNEVMIWAREPETVKSICEDHVNHTFLPGVLIPNTIKASGSLDEVCSFSDVWISAIPTQHIRANLSGLDWDKYKNVVLINASKGIEISTGKLIHQILEDISPAAVVDRFCTISGPSFAFETAQEQPTMVALAGRNAKVVEKVGQLFNCSYFRCYLSTDVIGTEVAGSLKNVFAIGTGIAEGLGFRINSQAALLTRGLNEIARFGVALGAERQTFMGLAGMGDLILTCLGTQSRNRQLGVLVGKGLSPESIVKSQKTIAEGYYTARAAYEQARHLGIETPLIDETYAVLYENKRPQDSLPTLMLRPQKWESFAVEV